MYDFRVSEVGYARSGVAPLRNLDAWGILRETIPLACFSMWLSPEGDS
jgi:hypothetical protein